MGGWDNALIPLYVERAGTYHPVRAWGVAKR